ncbi:hypothetical protein C475_08631 [Halosimplex carlsbadense 2-9-1]|uniref:Peptidase A2 domain-containing protein n=1 Tax=Halosimplex carlsbadense 2-9-1 TaxID=797114 RepID=M0CX30_9EURY|nr:hypothetical protein [Halosimplex carlsbadense]ELZ26987.1 hypothetical protein C475_08631 [Halosimplex carlsbadense 2-9-1]
MNNTALMSAIIGGQDISDPERATRAAAEAAGLELSRVDGDGDDPKLRANSRNVLVVLLTGNDDYRPTQTVNFDTALHASNWNDPDSHHERLDGGLELLRQLAVRFDADYVPLFDEMRWAEVIPSGTPLAEHVDSHPELAIYSESLLADLGGVDSYFDDDPWRVVDAGADKTLVVATDEPWGEACWTDNSFDDLRIIGNGGQRTDG